MHFPHQKGCIPSNVYKKNIGPYAAFYQIRRRKDMNVSAEEIMRKAVEAGEGMDHYYTLSESKVYQGNALIEHSILK